MSDEPQDTTTAQVEDTSASDNQGTPTASPDTATQSDTPNASGNQAKESPPDTARTDGEQPSLTAPKSVAPNTQNTQDAPIDPQAYKRLRDEKANWGRQMADTSKRYEEARAQIAKFQQETEQRSQLAANQKLALHDPRHPDHGTKFQGILTKADIVRQQLARINQAQPPEGLSPEQGQAWRDSQRNAIMGTLSDEEQSSLEQFNQHNQSFQRKLAINPAQAMAEYVTPMIRQEMESFFASQRAAQSVDADFNDPDTGPILQEMQGDMLEAVQRLGGTDEAYDFVKQQAVNYAKNNRMMKEVAEENARLKQQLKEAGFNSNVAAVQRTLAKGKASITRDVSVHNTRPPWEVTVEWAAKNGISKDSPKFFQHLRGLEAERAQA